MTLNNRAERIVLVPLDEIKLNPKNRNKHSPEQIAQFVKILRYQGFRNPGVISNRSGQLCAGEGRYLALKEMGATHMPCTYQDFEDEEQEYLYGISDNAIASQAELDLSAIHVDIGQMGPFDLDLLGLKDFQFEPDPNAQGDADAVPEVPKIAKTKRGELWTLGNHRLLIDDCTVKENVERLMAGEKAALIFTDPPYGVSYEQGKFTGNEPEKKFEPIANDELRGEDLRRFLQSAWIAAPYDEPCVIYSWAPPLREGAEVLLSLIESGWHIQSMLVWDKGRLILGRADYQWRHEICWYGYRGKNHYWCGDRDQTTVWAQARDHEYDHPTQKPVGLAGRAVRNSSMLGSVVYDGFAGSGSTLIACETAGRRFRGLELEPKYGDVILERWAKFTGKDPVREDGVKWSELNG